MKVFLWWLYLPPSLPVCTCVGTRGKTPQQEEKNCKRQMAGQNPERKGKKADPILQLKSSEVFSFLILAPRTATAAAAGKNTGRSFASHGPKRERVTLPNNHVWDIYTWCSVPEQESVFSRVTDEIACAYSDVLLLKRWNDQTYSNISTYLSVISNMSRCICTSTINSVSSTNTSA